MTKKSRKDLSLRRNRIYYTIFSLAPILVIVIAIAGLVFGEQPAQGEIVGDIEEPIGRDGAKAIQTMIQSAFKPDHSVIASAIGVVTLLFGATGAVSEV
jgi:membrane protein